MNHPPSHSGQAVEDLRAVCEGFVSPGSAPQDGAAVDANVMPATARMLLVHTDHMTSVLNAYYRTTVELRVLQERRGPDRYARMILLTRPDGGRVVEFGIARMHLAMVAAPVRAEILARRAPLGDILVRHDVLRRVDPRWYYRFPAGSQIAGVFGDGAGPAYGRVGTIYCNEEPAIEVLEVVADGI